MEKCNYVFFVKKVSHQMNNSSSSLGLILETDCFITLTVFKGLSLDPRRVTKCPQGSDENFLKTLNL